LTKEELPAWGDKLHQMNEKRGYQILKDIFSFSGFG